MRYGTRRFKKLVIKFILKKAIIQILNVNTILTIIPNIKGLV